MRTALPSVLRVLSVLIASACGGRSALDDETSSFSDGSDAAGGRRTGSGGASVSSGGSSAGGTFLTSGGTSAGGAFLTSGGTSAGGAITAGGAFTTGGDAAGGALETGGSGGGCPFGTFGDGVTCDPWSDCEPGEYWRASGTATQDTKCAPCPPDSFSTMRNESSCQYSGCEFSERVVIPATPATRASCEPDPDYHVLGPVTTNFLGLTSRGTVAYAGLFDDLNTIALGYESGAVVQTTTAPRSQYEWTQGFAAGPGGMIYLEGITYDVSTTRWVDGYDPSGARSFRGTFPVAGSPGFASGLLSTDSHWILWNLVYGSSSNELVLASSPHSSFSPAPEATVPFDSVDSIAADDQENIWLTGFAASRRAVGKIDGVTSTLQTIALSETFIPIAVTVTGAGTPYLGGVDESDTNTVVIFELDSSGSIERTFRFTAPSGTSLNLSALGVDPGAAVYAACSSGLSNNYDYWISGSNVTVLRIDLTTEEIASKSFVGPGPEWAGALAVTTDGSVYVGGATQSIPYVRRVF